MSRKFSFEGKTYSLPDDVSNEEALAFIESQSRPSAAIPKEPQTSGGGTATGVGLNAASKGLAATGRAIATGLAASPSARQVVGFAEQHAPTAVKAGAAVLGLQHGGLPGGAVAALAAQNIIKDAVKGGAITRGAKGWDTARAAAALGQSSIVGGKVVPGAPEVATLKGLSYANRYLNEIGKIKLPFKALSAITPTLTKIGNATTLFSGPTDIAQMAEPNRRDIGTAGIAFGEQPHVPGEHPAMINAAINYLLEKWKNATK